MPDPIRTIMERVGETPEIDVLAEVNFRAIPVLPADRDALLRALELALRLIRHHPECPVAATLHDYLHALVDKKTMLRATCDCGYDELQHLINGTTPDD